MEKIEVPLHEAYRLLTPGWVVLVGSQKDQKYNIMTASWQMPVSIKPPLVSVSIQKRHLTTEYIQATGAFTVNVPGYDILAIAHYCGSISGRDTDKFEATGLTPVPGKKVPAPLVAECLAGIECRVWQTYDGGDHFIFVGEVMAAAAAPGHFEKHWRLDRGKENYPFSHIGGSVYIIPGVMISISKQGKELVPLEKPLAK
ncbi:MAG: flavin reductase family protein [Ammonifex sp.]|nr:MAG: flavin reductase family protein [Ammonifex sp.]